MMPNDSTTGGPVAASPTPAPLEGQALMRFLQQWLVGITGLDGTLVRPQFQIDVPNIPDAGVAWMSFRLRDQRSDTYPMVVHDGGDPALEAQGQPQGADSLHRHETIEILCSFYDTGDTGRADEYMKILRDGLAISQNKEPLWNAGMGFVACGDAVTVPSLVKTKWLYRVDLPVVIRREVVRTYPVRNLLDAVGNVTTDTGLNGAIDSAAH